MSSDERDPALASYYRNHALGQRFPWSLYHGPINQALITFLSDLPKGAKALNVGCGTFLNLPSLPTQVEYTGTDIDPRAVAACRREFASRPGVRFELSKPDEPLPFERASFDAVFATEVIEHCSKPEEWLAELIRVCRPGGRILLTTPNYNSVSLNIIETTVLEVIARVQGFTRKGIHPMPFTPAALAALVRAVGGVQEHAWTTSLGWVAICTFRVPAVTA